MKIAVKQKQAGVKMLDDADGFKIPDEDEKYFEVIDKDKPDVAVRVPCQPVIRNMIANRDYKPFDIPIFGITMLGVSHGFDKVRKKKKKTDKP